MEKKYTTMQTTSYRLTFDELHGIMLFLRDYNWEKQINKNRILTKYVYETCSSLYLALEKRCIKALESKQTKKAVKFDFSELELLSIAILAKVPHENSYINMAINKIILQLPVEIINILKIYSGSDQKQFTYSKKHSKVVKST